MSKRNQQKREKRIAEVKARLADIYEGAVGFCIADDSESADFTGYMGAMSPEQFAGFVSAVLHVFDPGDEETASVIRCSDIKHFDTPDTLATWIVDEEERKAALAKAEGRQS